MRVCHVINNLHAGGAELMLERLIRSTRADGYQHSVVSLIDRGPVGQRLEDLGVPVDSLGIHKLGNTVNWRLLARHLRIHHPDVIQTWLYHSDLIGGFAAKLHDRRCPVVWNLRHSRLDARADKLRTRLIVRLCARLSHWIPASIVANSRACHEAHLQLGYSAERMEHIANGIDTTHFHRLPHEGRFVRQTLGIPEHSPVIGVMARFHPVKDHATLFAAVARIVQRFPDTHLILCGHDITGENASLCRLIPSNLKESHLHLSGPRTDLPSIYSALDVLVSSSLSESFPNVIAEAMACEVPCVSTDAGDSADIIGTTGIVVPCGQADALAEATIDLLNRPHSVRHEMGKAARARIASNYSMAMAASRYESLWERLSERRRTAERRGRPRPMVVRPVKQTESREAERRQRPVLAYVVTTAFSAKTILRGQLAEMRRRGYDVLLVTSPDPELEEIAQREGIEVFPVPMVRRIAPIADLCALWRLVRLFRHRRPEIVNAGTPKAGLLAMVAATAARVPLRIYVLRGLPLETARAARRWLLWLAERIAAACAHRIVCNSPSLHESFLNQKLCPRTKVLVLGHGSGNGVDVARVRPRSDDDQSNSIREKLNVPSGVPVLGFVGRLTHDKGIDDLLAVFHRVSRLFPSVHLVLVGDFEAGNPVSREVQSTLRNNRRVRVTGFVSDAADCYSLFDVLVFPSRREGLPNAVLEAAASGVPVVGYDVTGVRDAIDHGHTGYLVQLNDTEAMAGAVGRYLSDVKLRDQHGRAARQMAMSRYEQRRVWQQWAEFYRAAWKEHVAHDPLVLVEPDEEESNELPFTQVADLDKVPAATS